jgi:hypothetical protein
MRKQLVVLIAGLLLLASQMMSLAHAVDHPFHAANESCVSFISVEQHGFAVASVALLPIHFTCSDEFADSILLPAVESRVNTNPVRAPPLIV